MFPSQTNVLDVNLQMWKLGLCENRFMSIAEWII